VVSSSFSFGRKAIEYVNPFIGTGGHAHACPVDAFPKVLMDFSFTHLSGPGCVGYGNALFMPTTGDLKTPGSDDQSAGKEWVGNLNLQDETRV